MKLIAHRGNINGPNPLVENSPEYIDSAIDLGYDVEIDVRYDSIDEQFYLGHDDPQYIVSLYWLAQRSEVLWIHCKNIESLYYFSAKTGGYNYFWHQNDDFTLTSKRNIWAYPGKPYSENTVIVMPELNQMDWDMLKVTNCYGICSDYIGKLK